MSDRDHPDPDDTHRPQLSRRTFLAYGGTTLAAFVVPACGGDATSERVGDLDVSNLDADDWITIQRPDDLLNLRVGLVNFRRDGARIVRTGSPGLIVVSFPPQHLAEKVFLEGSSPDYPPIATNLAQESRVVFVVPEPTTELPLSSEQLLGLLGHVQGRPPPVRAHSRFRKATRSLFCCGLKASGGPRSPSGSGSGSASLMLRGGNRAKKWSL